MLFMIIISSILIYPSKTFHTLMPYILVLVSVPRRFESVCCHLYSINAIFIHRSNLFSSVDVNELNTWQQIVLYMMPMLTNPIFINMTVVFVRLFYFEREFKGIRTRSKEQSRYRRNFTREMTLASGIDPDQGFFIVLNVQ